MITAEKLREITAYDAKKGVLTWKVSMNSRGPVGARVGNDMPSGYVQTQIFGKKYYLHRLIWLYVTGEWPVHQIDHIDCRKSNNRFDNLRDASPSQNGQNRKRSQHNSATGLLGVSKNGRTSYRAVIKINGALKHIGNYPTPQAAHAAYIATKRKFHEFNTL